MYNDKLLYAYYLPCNNTQNMQVFRIIVSSVEFIVRKFP